MAKPVLFILYLSFLLVGLASALSATPPLHAVPGNKGFELSNELVSTYAQPKNPNSIGFHQAKISFNTTIPSINPDEAGVQSIQCKDDKITLTVKDESAIRQIKSWPNVKVMMLVSDKWKCFGENSTQFYLVGQKIIDNSTKKVSFNVEKCNISEWSESFRADISWIEKKKRRGMERRFQIDKSNQLNLNILFDNSTGKSSSPNLKLLGDNLLCANCFMQGSATLEMSISGDKFPFKLNEASVSLNGNLKLNADFLLNLTNAIKLSTPDAKLVSVPIPPGFTIGGLITVGPTVDLIGSGQLSVNTTGSATFGGEIDLPNFSAKSTFFVDNPTSSQSGFTPVFKSHGLTSGFNTTNVSVDVIGTLKPRLSFGITALGGAFSETAGFEIVAALDNNISLGSTSNCTGAHPRIKSILNSNLGFFFNKNETPIAKFPSLTLQNRCL